MSNKRTPKVYPVIDAIDDSETIKQFGYSASTISPGSKEKVVFRCSNCGRFVGRVRYNIRAPFKCTSCSKTGVKHKKKRTLIVYPITEYIDEAETIKQLGYSATTVSLHSNLKKVVFKCTACGRFVSRIRRDIKPPYVCASCAKTGLKHVRKPKVYPVIDPISDAETFKRFGYSAASVSPGGNKKVVFKCAVCEHFVERIRHRIVPPFRCHSCTKVKKDEIKPLGPIDEKATKEKYGYDVKYLSRHSNSLVVAICTTCNTPYNLRIKASNIKQECTNCRSITKQPKRLKTILERYPDGIPTLKRFGKVVNSLVALLEKDLGRKLLREKMLPSGKRLDIFDPETQVGIEYCGLYWHHENSLTPRNRNYHKNKMKVAQKERYRLITIFEDEYLEHKNAVVNRLLTILGDPLKTTGARKCSLISLDKTTVKKFLDKYHIQGTPTSFLYAYGLEYNNILSVVITGGKHHRQDHEKELILSRLCFIPGINISGGTERLFKKLCSQATQGGYEKIVSWSDNRWSEGTVYRRLGMVLEAELNPEYSYVVLARPGKRLSKQSQKKSNTGCPASITERDWALQHGLSRIWDCGKRRWTFSL